MEVKITEKIRYIGVDDNDIDLFENQYRVPDGMSYNSYVILDEKTAVLDTVDKRAMGEWEEKLLRTLNGRKVDYLVIHHLEPDHAGSIARLVELFPDVVLVGNAKTFQMFPQFFDIDVTGRTLTVKEGDCLSLGEHELHFMLAPMVHWPEVMLSYESTEKVLFTADAFGKFGALAKTENDDWACEARRYYFNIVGKYGALVQGVLKKVSTLEVACICPLHGPVLREDLGYYIGLYQTWSGYQPENRGVLIAVATIHGNTMAAAEKLAELLRAKGEETVVVSDLARADRAEVIEDAFRYDRIVLAASSYDGGVFPCMRDFLYQLQSKAYQNRRAALIENGSWGPTAGKTMRAILETMKNVEILEPTLTIRSTLKEADLPVLESIADALIAAAER
ncbi:MAG: MBL fold metallo-hydrolase [Lachnospiraceae bacterium]|nr:MBL fold metallo-hydrolase [Lachnospiraceae bacterium]